LNRRLMPILLAVVLPLLLAAVATFDGDAPESATPTFADLGTPSMPFVPNQQFLAATWFCAGVPAGGVDLGGSVTIANTADAPLLGELTVFTDAPEVAAAERDFEVPARSSVQFDLTELQPMGTFLSAMVEITGGGGFVEQQADHPDGSAVSPCSNSTSATWYFADNYTLGNSQEDLVITNPFPDDAILDVSFATDEAGVRSPPQLQGWAVAGHSVSVIDERYLAKDEAVLAITITATTGRVVAARSQQYLGERQGYSMSLGAPAGSTSWTFADGERGGDTVFERYSIYNLSGEQVEVQPAFLGFFSEEFTGVESIIIERNQVVSFNLADIPDLPEGLHGLVFESLTGAPIVVERAITRRTDEGFVTTVVRGVEDAFARPESGYLRWSMAIGTELAVEDVLVVLNLVNVDATVTVKALGPGGEVDVPGLSGLLLPANSVLRIAIPDLQAALGVPLVVTSTQPIIVERLLPRASDLRGRSGSVALPG